MNGLKNLAGNDVSIFLFRFELKGSRGIEFVINEAIHEDMYPELNEEMRPLAHACCETLLRYKDLSVSKTIMDCNVLDTGELEVMLSKGLGVHFREEEKQNLFNDAEKISDILFEVMDRRDRELGLIDSSEPSMEQKRKEKKREEELKKELLKLMEPPVRAGIKQMKPEDLPKGVTASRGYDQRGHCVEFSDKKLGKLGRIVLIQIPSGQTLVQTDLSIENSGVSDIAKKKKKLEEILKIVNKFHEGL